MMDDAKGGPGKMAGQGNALRRGLRRGDVGAATSPATTPLGAARASGDVECETDRIIAREVSNHITVQGLSGDPHMSQSFKDHLMGMQAQAQPEGDAISRAGAISLIKTALAVPQIGSAAEIAAYCLQSMPALPPQSATPAPVSGEDWRNAPEEDERWCAGTDFALTRLCAVLKVDLHSVDWDGSDGGLIEEADALILRILQANDAALTPPPASADGEGGEG